MAWKRSRVRISPGPPNTIKHLRLHLFRDAVTLSRHYVCGSLRRPLWDLHQPVEHRVYLGALALWIAQGVEQGHVHGAVPRRALCFQWSCSAYRLPPRNVLAAECVPAKSPIIEPQALDDRTESPRLAE